MRCRDCGRVSQSGRSYFRACVTDVLYTAIVDWRAYGRPMDREPMLLPPKTPSRIGIVAILAVGFAFILATALLLKTALPIAFN